jgi:hypothetical protein
VTRRQDMEWEGGQEMGDMDESRNVGVYVYACTLWRVGMWAYMCMHAHRVHARITQIVYEPAGENEKAGKQVACVHCNVTSSARNSISETRSQYIRPSRDPLPTLYSAVETTREFFFFLFQLS